MSQTPEKRVLLDLTYTEAELHTLGWILAKAYADWNAARDREFIDRLQSKIQDTLRQYFPKKKLPVVAEPAEEPNFFRLPLAKQSALSDEAKQHILDHINAENPDDISD